MRPSRARLQFSPHLLRRYSVTNIVITNSPPVGTTIVSPIETGPVNENYEPTDNDEVVLDVLKEGRANPLYIREKSELPKQRVNESLQRLQSAGWVERVTRGLYELVDDPREEG